MKDTLEYKILKHLKDNDNGGFVDMRFFIEDRKRLETKLRSLSKEPEKLISARFPVFVYSSGLPDYEEDILEAKIEFKGINYLESLNEPRLTKYQKIYLPFFIISILSAILLGWLNYLSNKKIDFLNNEYNLLKSEYVRYKDSVNKQNKKIEIPKEEKLKDTLSSNNSE